MLELVLFPAACTSHIRSDNMRRADQDRPSRLTDSISRGLPVPPRRPPKAVARRVGASPPAVSRGAVGGVVQRAECSAEGWVGEIRGGCLLDGVLGRLSLVRPFVSTCRLSSLPG